MGYSIFERFKAPSKVSCLSFRNYLDTRENSLIQGVCAILTEIPLVEIDVVRGKILCGLVESLPNGVDILVGNELGLTIPVTVPVVTRAGTDTTNNQAVVMSGR